MPPSTSDESGALKVWLHFTKVPSVNDLIYVWRISFKGKFKNLCWRVPSYPLSSALARLSREMLLHHTPSLENFHGLLSMSSRMVCPCFWISTSFSQLASSTRCPFNLTKFSKYSFRLVLLLTLLSSMLSICGFSATSIFLVHWTSMQQVCS